MNRVMALMLVSLLLLGTRVHAQSITPPTDEAFQQKLDIYTRAHPADLMFVHVDKTIYTNNESIWFCAYLIRSQAKYVTGHTILSVALVREDNKKVIIQDKYAMQDGLSSGSILLADSIPPGNYRFIAATNMLNKNGEPIAVFDQPLTVKSIARRNFNADLTLLDTVPNNGMIRARVTLDIKDVVKKARTRLSYSIGRGKEQTVTLKAEDREYMITIPREQLNRDKPVLLTTIKYDDEVLYLSAPLPRVNVAGITARFFPEGGDLIEGLESTVGWEVKNAHGIPLKISGTLLSDNKPLATITTNNYGGGTFKLTPDAKSRYSVKIAANIYLPHNTLLQLPKALERGVVVHMPQAVVNDTLRIILFSKEAREVKVRIHNYRESFAAITTKAKPQGKLLNIALGPEVPMGVATITVVDEEKRPLAERLFFAHYNGGPRAEIIPGKTTYEKKEKVSVKLKLTDKNGSPLRGIVSVACVQDNRVESNKQQDIMSYVYLTHDLAPLPPDPLGRGIANKEYLENMLMIKGWRRYTWQSLMNTTANDTLWKAGSPVFKGTVRYLGTPLKKPSTIILLRDSLIDLVKTMPGGSFELNRNQLLIRPGRKFFLRMNGDAANNYFFYLIDPFIPLNQALAECTEPFNNGYAYNIQNSKDQELKGLQKAIALREVVVKGKNDKSIIGGPSSNACGDYVCVGGILNCPWHAPDDPKNYPPVKGTEYQIVTNTSQKLRNTMKYAGCVSDKNPPVFRGIYTAREFYGVNMEPDDLPEQQYLSTLFWQAGLPVNDQGEADLSFYTGDITGKFRIVVQGVGGDKMIYGSESFMVK